MAGTSGLKHMLTTLDTAPGGERQHCDPIGRGKARQKTALAHAC